MSEETQRRQAVEPPPLRLDLILSEFTVLEQFYGSYLFGDRHIERQPEHKFSIHARWRYAFRSDKLVINGVEIEPNLLEIAPTDDKEVMKWDQARREFLAVHLETNVFTSLLDAVRQNDIEEAEIILQAQPKDGFDWLTLRFGDIRFRHAPVYAVKKGTPTDPARKRVEQLLYGIFIVLVLILVELWRR